MDLASSLNQDYLGNSSALDIDIQDPVVDTPMVINIHDIDLYEHNPRHIQNPKHAEIKASIESDGLRLPLCVTRKPGHNRFVVESGGNTRLAILKELYDETGDSRYERVNVLFKPWQSDIHLLRAHLVENTVRGEMCFVDLSMGIIALKHQLESTEDKLSWREFERKLQSMGLPYSHTQVVRMRFLVEKLLPLLPENKRREIGSHHVQQIQSAISEASKHYTGDLDFIDYYESSIRSWFESFNDISRVAENIRNLVQAEPSECLEAESDGIVSDSSSSEFCSDAIEESLDTVVQAEPPTKSTNDKIIALGKVIQMRAENYDIAVELLSQQSVCVLDDGVGFVVSSDLSRNSLGRLLYDLSRSPYVFSAEALVVQSEPVRKLLIIIFQNICAMLEIFSDCGIETDLSETNNNTIINLQDRFDDEQ